VPSASDPNLLASYNFDEESGMQTLSDFRKYHDQEIVAQFDDIYNKNGLKIRRWISASVQIENYLDVSERYPGGI
jgi:hypothetical protein